MNNVCIIINIFYLVIFILLLNFIRTYKSSIALSKNIETHFVIYHINDKKNILLSRNSYFIEHNYNFDDVAFLIPLYNIIIKSKIVIMCNESQYISILKEIYLNKKYAVISKCIYFDLSYLKLLNLHTNIFRFCKYDKIFQIVKNDLIDINFKSICKAKSYTYNYSIVTALYKRNNLETQISLFTRQLASPKHIIIVHERNEREINNSQFHSNILYVHAVNFKAGFYFR